MTRAANPNANFWEWDFSVPYPTQDTDLLGQLPFVPGLKQMLMLRQVHALEHATVWILSETPGNHSPQDNETLGGLSTENGFYLYGEVELSRLRRAVGLALHRIKNGESNLAVHPRCGTNLSVNMALTAGLAFAAHLLLPRGPIEQFIGLGLATTTAAQISPDLGSLAQKYLTTSIPFNLEIASISPKKDLWGRPANFVRVRWKQSTSV